MSISFVLIKAWLIGVAVAAPVGPIGVLCIRKTLQLGITGTVSVGLGAAFGDSVYGLIAALGLSTVSHFLLDKVFLIKIIGGLFLLYLAYKEVKSSYASEQIVSKHKASFRLISEVFFVTLANPMTILSIIAIFAGIGEKPESVAESLIMMLGIFLGSLTWWLFLGGLIIKIKHKLPETWLQRIKYFSALTLGIFGIISLLSILKI